MGLEDKLNELKKENSEMFQVFLNIFGVSTSYGKLVIPKTFRVRVREYFGSRDRDGNIVESEEEAVKRLEIQKIIKIYNKWTMEGALFNRLRASRPGMRQENVDEQKKKVYKLIEKSAQNCDFCKPEKYTPEDVFGRIKGKNSITGANIAKYDAWSSMIIFRKHDPLEFNLEELYDYIETGFKWFKQVYQHDEEFKYPFLLWNCLEKAGASQVHGHAQILMSKGGSYGKFELLKKAASEYRKENERDYFRDLYKLHELIGLGMALDEDIHIFANITPVKEKEMVILTPFSPSKSYSVVKAIFNTLRCYIDVLGVTSFNMAIYCPSFDDQDDLPYIVRIVDRGSIFKSTADIGAMELYGSSVISDDPYTVIKAFRDFQGP